MDILNFLCERLKGRYDTFCFETVFICFLPHLIFAFVNFSKITQITKCSFKRHPDLTVRIITSILHAINILTLFFLDLKWWNIKFVDIQIIDTLTNVLAWLLHAIYLTSITCLRAPNRGPFLILLYISILACNIVYFSSILMTQHFNYPIVFITVSSILHASYLSSLLFSQPSSHYHSSNLAEVSLASFLFFSWLNNFMKSCYNGNITTITDIIDLPASLKTEKIIEKFNKIKINHSASKNDEIFLKITSQTSIYTQENNNNNDKKSIIKQNNIISNKTTTITNTSNNDITTTTNKDTPTYNTIDNNNITDSNKSTNNNNSKTDNNNINNNNTFTTTNNNKKNTPTTNNNNNIFSSINSNNNDNNKITLTTTNNDLPPTTTPTSKEIKQKRLWLAKTLWNLYGLHYMTAGMLVLLTDLCSLSAPVLLSFLITFITSDVGVAVRNWLMVEMVRVVS